jgi:hypothetical protein
MRLVAVEVCPLPYHTPVLNELARLVDLHVIYMARRHPFERGGALRPDFGDEWGTESRFEHSFYWSRSVGSPGLDFKAQMSLGVSRRLAKLGAQATLVRP